MFITAVPITKLFACVGGETMEDYLNFEPRLKIFGTRLQHPHTRFQIQGLVPCSKPKMHGGAVGEAIVSASEVLVGLHHPWRILNVSQEFLDLWAARQGSDFAVHMDSRAADG